MSNTVMEQRSVYPPLSVSDKLSIINALMAQDRIEIRDTQEAVFTLTYYVVPGLVGVAAFSVGHAEYRQVLLVGQVLLLFLYAVAFFTFRKWLADARACQQIRESFYKDQSLLHVEPFDPIRYIRQQDRVNSVKDNALWFPFVITVAAALVLLAYMSTAQ
jgi:hypothetical protein